MDFLQSMPFYYYLVGGSAIVVLLAIILYFIPGGRIKIPAIASCALGSLFAGVGVGVVAMYGLGYHWEGQPTPGAAGGGRMGGGGMGGGGMGGGGGGGEGKKGPPGGVLEGKEGGEAKKGGGEMPKKGAQPKEKAGDDKMAGMQAAGRAMMGNFQPTAPKDRLVSLVTKLDLLTSKTPLIHLTDDQKSKIRSKLSALDKDEVKDDEAEKILDDILEIVEGDRKALEEVGFQYPGAGGAISRPHPNPFKVKIHADHLQSLKNHLNDEGS